MEIKQLESIIPIIWGESQRQFTEIADGQKSNLLLSEQGSTLHFSKTTIRIVFNT